MASGHFNPIKLLTIMPNTPPHSQKHSLITLLALPASLFVMASAQATSIEDTFRDFSKCDASFFKSENVKALNPVGSLPTGQRGPLAWLKASNNLPLGDAELRFPQQLEVAGVHLLSYSADNRDLDSLGLYYSWGFVASGDLADVTKKLRPLIYQNDRFRMDGDVFVRTEVKVGSSNWLNINTQTGSAAGTSRIERAFIIEKGEKPGTVSISCSLQGGVTPELLASDRPDLEQMKYPRPIDPDLYEKTPVSPNIARQISDLVSKQPEWKPQFHTLRYTDVTGKDQVSIEHRADGNYLQSIETYSPEFNVKRTSWANLVQLKSMANLGQPGKTVWLATKATFNWPKTLTKKANLSAKIENENIPVTDGERGRSDTSCTLKGTQPASKINAALSGQAKILICTSEDKTITNEAFIENLGIVLTVSSKSPNEDQVNHQFKDMVIER